MTDSLMNMLRSVDWSKLVSSGDAKNALVGSALGGLMLGGASLAQDRDPEESKAAPVGDALMGALLGGAAGYGIPKGLAMFRDAGHMAPDDDQIRGSGVLGAAGTGFVAGSGLVGASLIPTLTRSAVRKLRSADAQFEVGRAAAASKARAYTQELLNARANGVADVSAIRDKLRLAMLDRAMYEDSGAASYGAMLSRLKAELADKVRRGDTAGEDRIRNAITSLRRGRTSAHFGFNKITDLIEEAGNEGWKGPSPADKASKMQGLRMWIKNFTRGAHYATKDRPLGRLGPAFLRPGARMAIRAGKYGIAAAVLAALGKGLLGSGSRDNFGAK